MLLLAGPTHTQAVGIAEEIDARIQASTVETATGTIRPSASIGVATAHPSDSQLEDLIRLADERMYERKTARKSERARAAAQPQVDLTRAPTLPTVV